MYEGQTIPACEVRIKMLENDAITACEMRIKILEDQAITACEMRIKMREDQEHGALRRNPTAQRGAQAWHRIPHHITTIFEL